MGFFDKILNALGFEDDEAIEKKKEINKKQKNNTVKVKSKFDLDEISKEKTIKNYKPETQDEIESMANDLVNGNSIFVNFSEFSDIDRVRALDFLSGVTYVLSGKIEKQNNFEYVIKIDNKK